MKQFYLKALKPSLSSILLLSLILFMAPSCKKIQEEIQNHNNPKVPGNFQQVNLVANNNEYGAAHIDPLLLNAWGLTFSPTGTAWIGAEAGHVSTVYDKDGNVVSAISPVTIPSPGGTTGGSPSGVVFNGSNTDFILSNGQAARFLFAGTDGVLSGWNGAAGKAALLIKDNSATSAYTGLTLASDGGNNFLYAANFRAGRIDVFDRTFNMITTKAFIDVYLPDGYSPFNIQLVGNWLYVTYAKVGPNGDEVHQVGLGIVDIYSTSGMLLKRFATKGDLNAPWGVAQAPASFFPGNNNESAILIGNFGDGHINVYATDGSFLGQLRMNGSPLVIDGLWSLMFPPSTATTIDPNRLYFTAGPDDEQDGVFGYIIKK